MDVVFKFEVIKIAGAPKGDFWSQNFFEKPQDAEKLNFRGQLFLVVSLKSTQAPAELAHRFWINLSSQFYANLQGGVLTALYKAAQFSWDKLLREESFEEAGFIAASLWGKILYLVQGGEAAAGLVRSGKFSQILSATLEKPIRLTSASGFLQDGDLVFLATSAFFQEFTSLEKFADKLALQVEEELALKVGQSLNNEKIAAQVLKIKESNVPGSEEVVTFAQVDNRKPSLFKSKIAAIVFRFQKKQILHVLTKLFLLTAAPFKFLIKFLPKREIYLASKPGAFLKKRLFSLALSVLILVLIGSLAVGIWQRQKAANFEKFEKYFAQSQTLYEEAVGVSSLNRLKSRELLDSAKKNLDSAKKLKFEKGKVADLEEKINQANLQSLKLIKIDNPALVFDFSLLKTAVSISEIEKLEKIYSFDKTTSNLFLVEIEKKTGQIVAGGAEFSSFSNFTLAGNSAFFLKVGDGIYQFDLTKKELKKVIAQDLAWGEIEDLASFGGNLYLLDGKKAQIWKYSGATEGFSAIQGFIKEAGKLDFKGASLAIDGAIWVLTGDGKLYQATPQVVKLVEIAGLDRPLSSKTILRTDANAENLYIGDLGNSRILVLSKTGLYLAQYSSGFFANMSDFTVDEVAQKLYFAKDSKIFAIDLVK